MVQKAQNDAKDIQFTVTEEERKQKIFTLKKLEFQPFFLINSCRFISTHPCIPCVLTGEQVSYVLDEFAQLLVALLHSLFALVGFDQNLQSVHLRLVGSVVGFPHLTPQTQPVTLSRPPSVTLQSFVSTHQPGELVHLLHGCQDLLVQVFG